MTEEKEFVVPEGVGPHEARELEMLLLGSKPMAMFSDEKAWGFDFGEARFDKHVESGELVKVSEIAEPGKDGIALRQVYYARPEAAWRIPVIQALIRQPYPRDADEAAAVEEITGKLLGYSDQEIQAFFHWRERSRENLQSNK
jgi:hypothetical protein